MYFHEPFCLILAHQNTEQISHSVLESVMGNCATKIFGRTSGSDSTKMINMTDSRFSATLKQLTGLPDYAFLVGQKAHVDKEQVTPLYMRSFPPPPNLIDEEGLKELLEYSRLRFSVKDFDYDHGLESDQIFGGEERWRNSLSANMPEKMEWDIIQELIKESISQAEIIRRIKPMLREDVAKALKVLIDFEIIKKVIEPKKRQSHPYLLTEKGLASYATFDYSLIGSSEDTPKIVAKAVEHYCSLDWFVSLVEQDRRSGQLRPDFVAYDYEKDIAISVEIESYAEVKTHKEHVIFNMEKWHGRGFDRCHVWSTTDLITEVRNGLDEDKERVKTFVVDIDDE